jgi:hypothetical protein
MPQCVRRSKLAPVLESCRNPELAAEGSIYMPEFQRHWGIDITQSSRRNLKPILNMLIQGGKNINGMEYNVTI